MRVCCGGEERGHRAQCVGVGAYFSGCGRGRGGCRCVPRRAGQRTRCARRRPRRRPRRRRRRLLPTAARTRAPAAAPVRGRGAGAVTRYVVEIGRSRARRTLRTTASERLCCRASPGACGALPWSTVSRSGGPRRPSSDTAASCSAVAADGPACGGRGRGRGGARGGKILPMPTTADTNRAARPGWLRHSDAPAPAPAPVPSPSPASTSMPRGSKSARKSRSPWSSSPSPAIASSSPFSAPHSTVSGSGSPPSRCSAHLTDGHKETGETGGPKQGRGKTRRTSTTCSDRGLDKDR